jgi:ribose-phosphate pyrophosphokinase
MSVVLQGFCAGLADAERLAERLGIPVHKIALHRFPDGEMRVTVGPAARTVILYLPLDQPNDKLIALILAAEALRREGAARLVLVAPYLCYMRQDIAFHPGEAISQKAIGRLIAGLVDRVVTVDAHLHRTAEIGAVFPGIEADNLSAMPAIAAVLSGEGLDPATLVLGPDSESRPWVADLAGRIGLDHAVGEKIRHGDRAVEIIFGDRVGIKDRPVLLVDDIVSSGGTLVTAAKALLAAGASAVDVVVTHALFPPEMIVAFTAAGVRSIRSTYAVPHPTNTIPLDAVLAGALERECQGLK